VLVSGFFYVNTCAGGNGCSPPHTIENWYDATAVWFSFRSLPPYHNYQQEHVDLPPYVQSHFCGCRWDTSDATYPFRRRILPTRDKQLHRRYIIIILATAYFILPQTSGFSVFSFRFRSPASFRLSRHHCWYDNSLLPGPFTRKVSDINMHCIVNK